MERVGFVGLGIMGLPMARNALRAGFPLTVTNRTIERAKPLAEEGATVVRTPREVAGRSDIVVTMVTNSPDVEIDLQQKDLRIALGAAFAQHLSLPGTALVHELYNALQRDGAGREGNHALIKAIERLCGIEARLS